MEDGGEAESPPRSQALRMNIEHLTDKNRRLVSERELLRSDNASWVELERNRVAIVSCQQELSRAWIERHLSRARPQAA
jgi:hypothetical protein